MDFSELAAKRASCRAYQSRPVEEEALMRVVEAGRLAPSAANRQEWKFYLSTDKTKKDELIRACCGQSFVGQAPAFLAVCATKEQVMRCNQPAGIVDCSIAMAFMLLQAADLGLGACWLGMFDAGRVKNVLGIPAEYSVVAVSPLGYPASSPSPRPRKNMDELLVRIK